MADSRELVMKAKSGTITPEEISVAASHLASRDITANLYDFLYVVGRGYGVQYEALVASYLNFSDDPMLPRLALQILCEFWGRTSVYLDKVRRFLRKEPWDIEDYVRQMAISIAGEFLRTKFDPELMKELQTVALDMANSDVTRGIAVAALARSLGDRWQDLPPVSAENPESSWAQSVLDRVRNQLLTGSAPN